MLVLIGRTRASSKMDESDDEEEEVFSGVCPLPPGVRETASKKRRRNQEAQSTAFLYSGAGRGHPPAPEEIADESSVAAENALMAAMGLPTSLKQGTAEASDEYHVLAADPSVRLKPAMELDSEPVEGEEFAAASSAPPHTQPSEASAARPSDTAHSSSSVT